jgi:hypothetical protein
VRAEIHQPQLLIIQHAPRRAASDPLEGNEVLPFLEQK